MGAPFDHDSAVAEMPGITLLGPQTHVDGQSHAFMYALSKDINADTWSVQRIRVTSQEDFRAIPQDVIALHKSRADIVTLLEPLLAPRQAKHLHEFLTHGRLLPSRPPYPPGMKPPF